MNRQVGKAFTLIELLVVVAIIALLTAHCLTAHEMSFRPEAWYMSRSMSSWLPMSPIMVRAHAENRWYRRCVMWYSWGGRGAPEPFRTEAGELWINETNNRPYYGTRQRPLTVYMYPDIEAGRVEAGSYMASDAPVFQCPADEGYPDLPEGVMDDAPEENAGNRMFDTVGSSYRGSLATLGPPGGGNAFSRGVWGQRLDRLERTSRLLFGGDPLFYGFIGTDSSGPNAWPEVKRYGWHTEFMTSNELYADAHAAPTQAVAKEDPRWLPPVGELDFLALQGALGLPQAAVGSHCKTASKRGGPEIEACEKPVPETGHRLLHSEAALQRRARSAGLFQHGAGDDS